MDKAKGTVHKFGDNVDTDVIIPARYLNKSDDAWLASHCMEDINAINIGLAILECDEASKEIQNGDVVEVDFNTGVITDVTLGKTFQAQPFPEFIQNIIAKGGLLNSIG